MDFMQILLSQYPLFFLLALLSLAKYVQVRKSSAVKSITFVLLFGILLAAAVVCCFLGVQMKYWTMATIVKLGAWSWAGLVLLAVIIALIVAHRIEARINRRKMDKALKQAEKQKEQEVRRAREEAVNAERERAAEQAITAPAEGSSSLEDDPLPTDVLKDMLQ